MRKSEKEYFFNQLTIESGFTDLVTIKRVYFGLLDLIRKELRHNNTCQLPDLGKFHSGKGALRFQSDYKLRFYCRNVIKNST